MGGIGKAMQKEVLPFVSSTSNGLKHLLFGPNTVMFFSAPQFAVVEVVSSLVLWRRKVTRTILLHSSNEGCRVTDGCEWEYGFE